MPDALPELIEIDDAEPPAAGFKDHAGLGDFHHLPGRRKTATRGIFAHVGTGAGYKNFDPVHYRAGFVLTRPPIRRIIVKYWSIMMRAWLIAIFVASGCVVPASAQSSNAADVYYQSRIKPSLDSYIACAAVHLQGKARSDPTLTFDAVERTLKGACGAHVERVRFALAQVNFTSAQSNAFIRDWYTKQQDQLRSLYTAEVQSEMQRRALAQGEARKREQEKQAEMERGKLFAEIDHEEIACFKRELIGLVPYSSETADTLAGVIKTKCAGFDRKRESLAIAAYGLTRSEAEKLVHEAAVSQKQELVALIVSLRADLAKAGNNERRDTGL